MQIIILAAGKGTRMQSDLPKVMHKVGDKPMLEHVVNNCSRVSDDLVLVYSDHLKEFLPNFSDRCRLARQDQQLGTAHAVHVAKKYFSKDEPIAVIYGDNPLITPEIINNLCEHMQKTKSQITTLAFEYDGPNAYGRIIVGPDGEFEKIIEYKFATPEERKQTLCNSGIMSFAPGILQKYIDKCLNMDEESGKEMYLTEIIEICQQAGEKTSYYLSDSSKLVGVNTQEELTRANSILNSIDNKQAIASHD